MFRIASFHLETVFMHLRGAEKRKRDFSFCSRLGANMGGFDGTPVRRSSVRQNVSSWAQAKFSLSLAHIVQLLLCAFLAAPASAQEDAAASDQAVAEQREEGGATTCAEGEKCAAGESGGVDLGLGELVNADALSSHWQNRVQSFLDQYNLSASLVGQLIASLIILAIVVLCAVIGKRVLRKLLHRMRHNKFGFQVSLHRMHFYRKCANIFFGLLMACLALTALIVIWNPYADQSLVYELAIAAFRLLVTLGFLFALAAAVYEVVSAVMEHFFLKWGRSGSARVSTLLPIARNVVNCALLTIIGITIISELGINVMPLLAGAGVIGFAVGFGAQTIIKDLITGFIIIFEDLVQVGDVIVVGGKGGLVEKITIRKIQLRGLDGSVFTVPYSEITIIENMTKEFSYYLMNVGVAYRENTDEVIAELRAIGEEMQEEAPFKDSILAPLEVLGVDGFADSAVIIKARFKTVPLKQWEVGREFNRRMKLRFDEKGIEIPFPHQTLYFGQGKDGDAPAAKVELLNQPAANDASDTAG